MKNYDPAMSFDKEAAAHYDQSAVRGDEAATVAFLHAWARGGPALELAIGTGRIALPLAATGVLVDGIDIAPDMVAVLRGKPGGDALNVTMGNFADVAVEGKYRLIYVVFNTLFNLLTQDEQVRCFENVARRLTDDGVFVVEGGVPTEFYKLDGDQYVHAEAVEVDSVRFDVARFDPVTQVLEESHVTLGTTGIRVNPIVTRYAWPAELDLMARIAGLELRERWSSWARAPFTGNSANCISVYGRRG
jgi:SAM-dependent methyltransferase